jgi:hypothetical protein
MSVGNGLLIAIVGLVAAAVASFIIFRWRQRDRVRRVKEWVGHYLSNRYGAAPGRLNLICSDDRSQSVLASFDHPTTGIRENVRFACAGSPSVWSVEGSRPNNSRPPHRSE